MTEGFEIARIPLESGDVRRQLAAFLSRSDLRWEDDIETAFGVFSPEGELAGCGCAAGGLLKCFAVDERLRGQNALGLLCSALMRERFSVGCYDLFVITRSRYEAQFLSCGFYSVAKTEELSMLENRPGGPERFAQALYLPGDEEKTVGAAVMNCNPFTLGHRSLIERAAAVCDVLHVLVVEENRSLFPVQDRLRLVREGTADLPNVRVHLSGHYMISRESFPAYFLKEGEDAAAMQSRLDVTLFARRIAPSLHISVRFAGQEPDDPVTAQYNRTMRELLPQYGIAFREFPRLEVEGNAISAARVRALLEQNADSAELSRWLPECTLRYLAERKRGGT